MKLFSTLFLGAQLLLQTSCSLFGINSVETTAYKVLVEDGDKEIRRYQAHIIAKTTAKGEYRETQNKSFKILAGYIFGKNKKKQDIAMTAPVLQKEESQEIAMTAPVLQSPSEKGWVMSFMMPSQYKMEDLPTPLDERISFEKVPAKTVATIRYAWSSGKERNKKKAKELLDWLENQKRYKIISKPIFAGYNPPWTLSPFRRNEMMIEITDSEI